MGLTNFPYGVASMGVPILGGPGLMSQGQAWFVKPSTGSDGNDGKSPERALKTLSKAHSLATADQNDVVYYFAQSNTAASTTDYQSSTLTWSKDLVHLIGIGAPSMVSQRSRIANTASSNISPVVTFSCDGSIIANVQILNGDNHASALLAATVSGTRNYFHNVHFAGIAGGSTQSAAGAASISLTGSENVFHNCVIGVDTASYDADATGVLCDTDASRNLFDDCLFQGYITAAGYSHVKINDTTGIDRWLWFRRCMFLAKSTNKATTQTEVFNVPAGISQGAIVLQDCAAFSDGGATVWTGGTEGIIWNSMASPAASAAGGIATNL